MNVNDNEIRRSMPDLNDPNFYQFRQVPNFLQKEAEELLGDKESLFLPMNSQSRLARWAQNIRENQKK